MQFYVVLCPFASFLASQRRQPIAWIPAIIYIYIFDAKNSVNTGFPKKDARFSKIKNIPDLLSDDKEGKIMRNSDFRYFSNRASSLGKPLNYRGEDVQ